MTRFSRWPALLAVSALGCQLVAGLEDRSLAPASAAGADQAGTSGSAGAPAAGQAGQGGSPAGGTAGLAGTSGTSGTSGQSGCVLSLEEQCVARPPPRTVEPTPKNSAEPRIFVMRKAYFGNREPGVQGKLSPSYWKQLGYDLDGRCTTSQNRGQVCRRVPNLVLDIFDGFDDGDQCRDNAFGGLLFRAVGTVQNDFDIELNDDIEYRGASTFLLEIEDLDEGPDDGYAPANLYLAAHTSDSAPDWNKNNPRILDKASALFYDASKQLVPSEQIPDGPLPKGYTFRSRLRFASGYVANNRWVSGPFDPTQSPAPAVETTLPLGGLQLDLRFETIVFALEFSDDKHTFVQGSTLAGVVSVASLEERLDGLLAQLFPPQCNQQFPGAFDPKALIRASADLRAAPPYQDPPFGPQVDCDAISLGMRFDWTRGEFARSPEKDVYVAKSKPIDPCAGKGGAGGAAEAGGASGSSGSSGQSGSAGSAGKGGASGAAGKGGAG